MEDWKPITRRQAKSYLTSDFKNEKVFCDLVEFNLKLICERVFEGMYISQTIYHAFGLEFDRLVLFTTDYNDYDDLTIQKYNLPVEVFFISREKVIRINGFTDAKR